MDTETTPATGSRVAERMITRNEAAFLIGAVHSGVANAISQVAQKYGTHLPQHQLQLAHRGRQGLPPHQVRLGRQRHQLLARHRQERDQGQRAQLGAADQRLRLGPQHLQGHARHRRGQRRQDRRGADGAAEHARLLGLPAQAAADQAASGRHRRGRRRHQGAAPAGGAAQAAPSRGLDQQPAGLARRLRPGAGRHLRRVRHHLVLPARPAGGEGVRRRLPEAVSRAWRSACRATSTTTATWPRASCCAASRRRARPTTSRSSRSWRAAR